MDMNVYYGQALQTVRQDLSQNELMVNAALGLAGEAGEVADLVKKVMFHDRVVDRHKLIEELGDVVWYTNLMLYVLESSWDEVTDANIAKLSTRYPDLCFDTERANNRDTVAERAAVMEALLSA